MVLPVSTCVLTTLKYVLTISLLADLSIAHSQVPQPTPSLGGGVVEPENTALHQCLVPCAPAMWPHLPCDSRTPATTSTN